MSPRRPTPYGPANHGAASPRRGRGTSRSGRVCVSTRDQRRRPWGVRKEDTMNTTRTTRTTRLAIRSLVVAAALGAIPVTAALATPATATTTTATGRAVLRHHLGLARQDQAPWPSAPSPKSGPAGTPATTDSSIDLKGRAPGYTVKYVDNVYTEGQGPWCRCVAAPSCSSSPSTPRPTRSPAPSASCRQPQGGRRRHGLHDLPPGRLGRVLRGHTSMGLGVRARLPFRVFTLDDGTASRLVIDVAHRW